MLSEMIIEGPMKYDFTVTVKLKITDSSLYRAITTLLLPKIQTKKS